MSGAALAREAARAVPGLPALLITGYAHLTDGSLALPRLAKPFSSRELTAAVIQAAQAGQAAKPA